MAGLSRSNRIGKAAWKKISNKRKFSTKLKDKRETVDKEWGKPFRYVNSLLRALARGERYNQVPWQGRPALGARGMRNMGKAK